MTPLFAWLSERAKGSEVGTASDTAIAENTTDVRWISELIEDLAMSVSLNEEADLSLRMTDFRRKQAAELEEEVESRLQESMDVLQHRLVGAVTRAIEPLLCENIVRKGIADFISILERHMKLVPEQAIQIKTPKHLNSELSRIIGEKGISVEVCIDSVEEISSSAGATEIETDISHWSRRLREPSIE